jgi:pilus assembly protein FimV
MAAAASAAPDIELDLSMDEPAPEAAAEASSGLDFDLGSPGAEATTGTDVALDLGAAPAAETPMDLGFDLSLDADPKVASSTDFTPEGPQIFAPPAGGAGDTAAAAVEPAPDAGLDISFDLPSPDAPAADAPVADAGLSGASIDFDLALGEPDKAAEAAAAPLEMDLSSISLDMGTPGDAAAPTGDARWQEVATKLDLAKAYEEMGDKDGARDLLKEVIKEGDGAQQQQAKTLLAALG